MKSEDDLVDPFDSMVIDLTHMTVGSCSHMMGD